MNCPHCRTRIRAIRRPDACPHCGRSLVDDDGRALRTVDNDYPALRARLDEKSLHRLKQGAVVVAVIAVIGVIPVIGALAGIPLLICHFIWCRTLMCVPYSRHYSTGRRILTRWLSRFFVLTTATLHSSVAVPFLAILVSPAVVAGTAGICWWYHRLHLEREHQREPIHLLEKILVGVAAVVAITAVALTVFLIMALGAITR